MMNIEIPFYLCTVQLHREALSASQPTSVMISDLWARLKNRHTLGFYSHSNRQDRQLVTSIRFVNISTV